MAITNLIIFVLLLSLMVVVHELGHFILAKRAGVKVEEFGVGYPPRLFAFKRGETEYSINILPLGGFVRLVGEEDPADPQSFARASKVWRLSILAAGALMNIFLAIFLFAGSFMAGWPTPVETEVRITYVAPSSPAEAAGFRPGDVVLSINGESIDARTGLRPMAEANKGKEITVLVRRDGSDLPLKVTPRAEWPPNEGPIGIAAVDYPTKVEPVSQPFLNAIGLGLRHTVEVILFILYVPVLLLKGALPLELARPVGPVGIYQITSQAATETVSTGWLFPILNVAGLLSASLGVANLLPIPGLDGGRLLFVVLEAIRGKRVSPEREAFIHFVGMGLLISLIIVVSYFDILSPVPTIDWGMK